ncbi:P-loop containing nucleoside triphosphate hydrolase protein [Trematosphaeria pertusa]|uniref:P-loop containing nucleoside triphosphate hydrolase protein n=1 Tax=Trematosphaeria pertusa TaxID=390896 RepID=A0A6A6HYX8_9PLEO|nr:P-loop containing nucleoside triphosphate hydrolase protein [Trematosphaeria pertusa]KAF2242978.1 P-loop containing nucleoside triphosphate hydrolase protein [Trematosphaeria pertusa]
MANQDLHMLSSSSSTSHRLPTVSASQALQSLHAKGARSVSTGLSQLNRILAPSGLPGRSASGGYMRGKVTEVFGPPGVGKTAFGIQAAANALRDGHRVVWVDAACAPLVPQRFNDVLFAVRDQLPPGSAMSAASPPEVPRDELQNHFHHFTASTLVHLLALFVHPPSSFPPPNTSLIVIDSLSTLFDNAYPRNADDRASRNRTDATRWAAGRKFAVMNELISTLTKTAALHDIALLITNQTITRIRSGSRALLVPAISGTEWDNGISTRLVLFRDWVPGQGKWSDANADRLQEARFVGAVKTNGATLANEGGVGNVVPFTVDCVSLRDLNVAAVDIAPAPVSSQARPPKRRFAEIDDDEGGEPDSDELYGWVEDDEVAAEGLLIEEAPITSDVDTAESGASPLAESQAEHVAEQQGKKVTRPATL